MEPFTIDVPRDVIDDLKDRIRRTRWPDDAPGPPWSQGTDLTYLQRILSYWAEDFDWWGRQQALNEFPHFVTQVDGVRIHYVHHKAETGPGLPVLLLHGWPSCFIEYLGALPLLTQPDTSGLEGIALDVVIPSLPGYGFSQRPAEVGINYALVAAMFHQLMAALGYTRFVVGGGDFGSGVAAHMAIQSPEKVVGLHLTNLDIGPGGPGGQPWSDEELDFLAKVEDWDRRERGYSSIQSTKPQTLGYGLNDSPAGLAAWLMEKWRSWTDSGGDPASRLSEDFLCTLLTVYWVTGSISSSMRDYFDNRWHGETLASDEFIETPTAIALFGNQFVAEADPPRSWVERLYNVQRWTLMPSGGHFGPAEEPRLFAEDLFAFCGSVADR